MRTYQTILMTGLLFFLAGCKAAAPDFRTQKPPVDHMIWNMLLERHVGHDGMVDYQGFLGDSAQLNAYLHLLSSTHPRQGWAKGEKMAYWINAYNAFTVKLILNHYPLKSIKDIKSGIPFVNSVWDIKFIRIEGETYDLNHIEHSILRREFDDPRIHAAINCASISCPKLLNEAYTAAKLVDQLESAMRQFVNDPVRNRITKDRAEISKIFSWFGGDFKEGNRTLRDYINQYAIDPVSSVGKIEFLDYDWRLNKKSSTGRTQ